MSILKNLYKMTKGSTQATLLREFVQSKIRSNQVIISMRVKRAYDKDADWNRLTYLVS